MEPLFTFSQANGALSSKLAQLTGSRIFNFKEKHPDVISCDNGHNEKMERINQGEIKLNRDEQ